MSITSLNGASLNGDRTARGLYFIHLGTSIRLNEFIAKYSIYRFSIEEICRLATLLRLHAIPWRRRLNPNPETALCVVLACLAYPSRWSRCSELFGRSPAWLSTIFNDVVGYLVQEFKGLLQWHPQLTYEQMQVYAKAVEAISDCPRIWGFVDGTFRGFSRPGASNEAQRRAYSGHKRQHGQNFQAIVTPNGLVSSLIGPFFGPTND